MINLDFSLENVWPNYARSPILLSAARQADRQSARQPTASDTRRPSSISRMNRKAKRKTFLSKGSHIKNKYFEHVYLNTRAVAVGYKMHRRVIMCVDIFLTIRLQL